MARAHVVTGMGWPSFLDWSPCCRCHLSNRCSSAVLSMETQIGTSPAIRCPSRRRRPPAPGWCPRNCRGAVARRHACRGALGERLPLQMFRNIGKLGRGLDSHRPRQQVAVGRALCLVTIGGAESVGRQRCGSMAKRG